MAFSKFWYNKRYRTLLLQAGFFLSVIAITLYFANNAVIHLEKQGIASGFDFLSHPAGFDIIFHLIDYNDTDTYFRVLIVGILNTLLVAILGIIFATLLGFIIGIMRLSHNAVVKGFATCYVETFRNLPLLLQIFFWYFAILRTLPSPRASLSLFDTIFLNIRGLIIPKPSLAYSLWPLLSAGLVAVIFCFVWIKLAKLRFQRTHDKIPVFWPCAAGFVLFPMLVVLTLGSPIRWSQPVLQGFNFQNGLTIIPELIAMLLSLSIYTAAFIAEIVRAGILSVAKAQKEAAAALGLSKSQTLKLIVLPQATRIIVPLITSQYLNLAKNSSLAAAIAYPDLVSIFAGTVLNQTGQAIEVIFITMSLYLSLSLMISAFMNWYNHKTALPGK